MQLYSRVRLVTDRFRSEGVEPGDLGYIIEMFDEDAFEVEFSDANGITIALIVARHDEITLC